MRSKFFGEELEGGRFLPLVEEFYSLQGEGFQMGRAAYFIRVGGCDLACSWCDSPMSWNPGDYPPVAVADIVSRAAQTPAKAVVVTGGEPGLYPLDYICAKLKEKGVQTFVETSGAYGLTGQWDWICLSPKKQQPPVDDIYMKADELKVVIASPVDLEWAAENALRVKAGCHLFLQPEWSCVNEITPLIIEFILQNPQWRISIQAHKYMRIP